MVKRTASGENEPEQKSFDMPSEREHLLQVVDVYDMDFNNNKLNLDPNTVAARLEVVGGNEEGLSMLCRLGLDDNWRGFFATRTFLKACGLAYKGKDFPIDTDEWPGRQFYATVIHVQSKGKTYANIKEYNFDKKVDNSVIDKGLSKAKDKVIDKKPDVELEWDADLK